MGAPKELNLDMLSRKVIMMNMMMKIMIKMMIRAQP